jgi:hypothetical protein
MDTEVLTFRLPSCENLCPQPGALHSYSLLAESYITMRETYKGFCPSVSANVNLKVCLLVEALVAVRHMALIAFPGFLSDLWFLNLH